jgi:superfamily II DNA/RNA helicase
MRGVKIGNFFGGIPIVQQKEQLKKEVPTIVVGTPGRIKQVGQLLQSRFVWKSRTEPDLDSFCCSLPRRVP